MKAIISMKKVQSLDCLNGHVIQPTPDWFPNWKGQTVIVIASGPSANQIDYEPAITDRVVVINNSWQLAPWADVLYGCDYEWWKRNKWVPEFKALRIAGDERAKHEYKKIEAVTVMNGADHMQFQDLLLVGRGGGNSGFQALNLIAKWGPPKKILLCGFDASLKNGIHWHGPHPSGMNNPRKDSVEKWKRCLDGAAFVLKGMGITVINCSKDSELSAYPKMPLIEALRT
jgi:hypothetical protein